MVFAQWCNKRPVTLSTETKSRLRGNAAPWIGHSEDAQRTEEKEAWENNEKEDERGQKHVVWHLDSTSVWSSPAPDQHSPIYIPAEDYFQLPTVWTHSLLWAPVHEH